MAGSSGPEEEAVKEVERPSLPKILAEEDTRPERPSLQKIPAEEDTRLDPGSGTEEDEEDTRLDPGSGTEEADKPYTRLDPVSGAKKVYDVEKEADEAIEVGRKMLRRWAADHGMPDALKRQRVLALLASAEGIFPDQAVASNRVLHCIQDEVHIILAVRAAREEAEEEAGSSGTEEETEEEEAEEEDEWDFEGTTRTARMMKNVTMKKKSPRGRPRRRPRRRPGARHRRKRPLRRKSGRPPQKSRLKNTPG